MKNRSITNRSDSVKTRVQNQSIKRSILHGQAVKPELVYHGYRDCIQKVFKHHGIRGFYSGLGAVLVGVGPEKAIKLTVNDYCRAQFAASRGQRWGIIFLAQIFL